MSLPLFCGLTLITLTPSDLGSKAHLIKFTETLLVLRGSEFGPKQIVVLILGSRKTSRGPFTQFDVRDRCRSNHLFKCFEMENSQIIDFNLDLKGFRDFKRNFRKTVSFFYARVCLLVLSKIDCIFSVARDL